MCNKAGTDVKMIMIDGSTPHNHAITNFKLINTSEENGVKTFNGTSTLNLIEGPVIDVPTSIKLLGKIVISIWIDPSKVEEHYGNYPIYGVIELNEENEKVELNRTIS